MSLLSCGLVTMVWDCVAADATWADAIRAEHLSQWSDAVRAAVARVEPSVVTIETVGGMAPTKNDLSELGSRFRVAEGPTTGLIVSSKGLILTSSFNFTRDPSVITVTLLDGRRLLGRLLGRNRVLKLALVQIDAEGLAVPDWAPEDQVRVGQTAIALGRGYGTAESAISLGIISAVGRMAGHAVQTDAKLSPANYGGPLIDLDGRVVGLSVPMGLQPGELAGVEWYDAGIGFAIPVSVVRKNVKLMERGAEIDRGYIGIEMADTPHPGVLIRRIAGGSPAERVGLKVEDRITRIQGNPIMSRLDLLRNLNVRAAGDEVELTVIRSGDLISLRLSLGRFEEMDFGVSDRRPLPGPDTQPGTSTQPSAGPPNRDPREP